MSLLVLCVCLFFAVFDGLLCVDILNLNLLCKVNEYYKESLGECFQCSDICNNRDKTGTSLKTCEFNCPAYLKNNIEDSTSGLVFLEIGLPILVISLAALVLVSGFLYRRRNNNRRRDENLNDIPMQVLIPLTVEEQGPGGDIVIPDSGIEIPSMGTLVTTETNESATGKLVLEATGAVVGLSDHCGLDTTYPKTASDNTPSQMFY